MALSGWGTLQLWTQQNRRTLDKRYVVLVWFDTSEVAGYGVLFVGPERRLFPRNEDIF